MLLRKLLRPLSYYILPLGLLIYAFYYNSGDTYSLYGYAAVYVLAVVLYIKPLSLLTNIKIFKILMTYRRELGLASFWLFLAHGVGFFLLYGMSPETFTKVGTKAFYGGLGGALMIIIALTSNDKAVKALKANWKRIQRLAYPAFFFALYHTGMAEDNFSKLYLIGGIYLLLKVLQFAKTKTI